MNHFYASQNMPALVDEPVTYTLTLLIDASSSAIHSDEDGRRHGVVISRVSSAREPSGKICRCPPAAPFLLSVGNEKQTPEKWWGEFKFIFLPSLRPEKQQQKNHSAHIFLNSKHRSTFSSFHVKSYMIMYVESVG